MKKSTLFAIVALVVLGAIAIFVYKSKGRSGTIDAEASNFQIKDTTLIDKIFIADKEQQSVTLTLTDKGWMVNEKYPARADLVSDLMRTFLKMEVKSPLPKETRKTVIQRMAARSTKVEVYSKGTKIKQFYVGGPTFDHKGTYMLLTDLDNDRNYDEPFIIYIPGFDGFLTPRFLTDLDQWRRGLIIDFEPPQMKQVKMEYYETPDSSFTIDLANANSFSLKNHKGIALSYDMVKMKQYLSYFQNVYYERLLSNIKDHTTDSLKTAIPFATMTISDTGNQKHVYNFFHKYPVPSKTMELSPDLKYDPDRMYLKYQNDEELAMIQFYTFGKLMPSYLYFLEPSVKK